MYMVLGYTEVTERISAYIKDTLKEEITIVLDQEQIASDLRESGYGVVVGKPRNMTTLTRARLKDEADVVVVMGESSRETREICETIKREYPDKFIVAIADRKADATNLKRLGIERIYVEAEAAAEFVNDELAKMRPLNKLTRLRSVLKASDARVAILIHDNPDPDAISSAAALSELAKKEGVETEIMYAGEIGRDENRALINLLGAKLTRVDVITKHILRTFKTIALVDVSNLSYVSALTADRTPQIIIDHHLHDRSLNADFVDIRTSAGSTAAIMTQYVQLAGISLDKKLASALLYGIMTDTAEFTRGMSPDDIMAVNYLVPLSDQELLEKVKSPSVSLETANALAVAIQNRDFVRDVLISTAGVIGNRDAIPQACEYLLKLEGVSTTFVFAIVNENIIINARTKDVRMNVADVMKRAFGDLGSTGGHPTSAGATVPLGVFSGTQDEQMLISMVKDSITRRLLQGMRVEK
jgi:nanoRNase/pAp phosphatase (c-di-AMP/oligoRNAs hydrolase)